MNLTLPLIFAQPATTADLTQVYAIIPFLNVLFTYGLETAYFRFSSRLAQLAMEFLNNKTIAVKKMLDNIREMERVLYKRGLSISDENLK